MSVHRTSSEDETIALGREIAAKLPRHAVVLLIGNLGAGKTTLAKGIIDGLGAAPPDEVSSPTFTLIHEYGSGSVYHIDLYRLETLAEVASLGLDEILDRDAVVLVEWGERFPSLWPLDHIKIRFSTEVPPIDPQTHTTDPVRPTEDSPTDPQTHTTEPRPKGAVQPSDQLRTIVIE